MDEDDDCDVRERIMAKAQLRLSKLGLDAIRSVHRKETTRKSTVAPPSSFNFRYRHVEIKEFPRFVKRLQATDIIAGRKGKLEVIISGVPEPEVKWYKNWIPLQLNDNIQICQIDTDHYVLNIYDAQSSDSGLYTCKARNDSGSVNTSAMVQVVTNNDVHNHKSHATIPNDSNDSEWTSEWSEEMSEDFARIRRQLHKLAEDLRQNEEIDLLYKKEVARGKHRRWCK